MSASNALENMILKAVLQGTDLPFRAAATQYLAAFTADPTETQSLANECNYTGYARVALTKATAWTDGGSTFSNADIVQLGLCTAGANTITHVAIVDTASGAISMMWSGILAAVGGLDVSNGIRPTFDPGTMTFSAD